MRLPLLLLILGSGLHGCAGSDPILDRANALDDGADGAAPTATAPKSPQPAPGKPAEPKPVQAADPPPANPGQPSPAKSTGPQPGASKPPPPPDDAGGFKLSGAVVLDDHKGGTIRVDIFDGDQKAASGGGQRPSVVAMARMESPGSFEVTIPATTSQVWIGAFADEDQDGKPGPLDPEIWYGGNPVAITADTNGIELVLERREPPPNK